MSGEAIRAEEVERQSESAIDQIRNAEQLILQSYGKGLINMSSHPDAAEVHAAARTLTIHLAWLKSRAAAQAATNLPH